MTDAQSKNPKTALNLKNLLLTGIVGWIAALYTLWHSAKVHAGVDLGDSFCNVNEKINCDSVALSKYSNVLGIPVPVLGLIFFVIVILLAMRALKQMRSGQVGDLTRKLLVLSAGVGVACSLIFGLISATKIGAFCLVCCIVYFLCFSNLYFTLQVSKEVKKEAPRKDTLSPATIFIFAAVILAQYLFYPLADFAAKNGDVAVEEDAPTELLQQAKTQYSTESSYEIPVQKSPSVGSTDAKVTVVEFSDFQCPHCANNHKNMPPILKSFGSKVRVIYKNFPLDPACNTGGPHRNACYSAYAARCVFNKFGMDSFVEMQDYLFKGADSTTKESIAEKAVELGFSKSDFESCLQSSEVRDQIKEEIDLGRSLNIEGTPAIFVNGKLLKMGANPAILKSILRAEVEK